MLLFEILAQADLISINAKYWFNPGICPGMNEWDVKHKKKQASRFDILNASYLFNPGPDMTDKLTNGM